MADRFYIAPYDANSGMQTNLRPWLIPDEAFSELTNAYVFRGRLRKRFGTRWFGDTQLSSRLRVNIATTDGSGNVATFVPRSGVTPLVTPAIGQMFSIGATVFTVNALGTPAALLRSDGAATTATFNTTTGALVINGAIAATTVYYYPALPVMGLLTYDTNSLDNEFIIGFDTKFAYQYSSGTAGWERLSTETTPGASVWNGSNSQFFWGETWSGANASDKVFFVTNFNENEPNFIRTFDGTAWDNFSPSLDGTNNLISSLIVVPFKNRLLAFNTWEGTNTSTAVNYQNRLTYSQVGSPLASDAWRQDVPGKGNAIDAATTEAIVSIEFVKDRLIVYLEQSVWEIAYTGNQIYPFTWQQINTELGAESTFSIVPFDKIALAVGNVGIMACNGSNVERIDERIPDTVFEIHNVDSGINRVYGIRDYFVEMVYWTFPDTEASADFPYPNKVLVYNYQKGTWALNEDSITAFGYFQSTQGVTWDSQTVTWDDDQSWNSGELQAQFRQVVGGNQEGYTFVVDADATINASVIQITDLTVSNNIITITAIDHNFRSEDYVYLSGITAIDDPSNPDHLPENFTTLLNGVIFEVEDTPTKDEIKLIFSDDVSDILTGIYTGGGVISRVSNISVRTKEYNFYAKEGRNAYVSKVDFMVDATDAGQMQVQFFVSTSLTQILEESADNGTLLGTGTLDTFPYPTIPFEQTATRLWHPVYFQADGEVIQFFLTMNDEQMRNPDVRDSDFQMHAMCIYAEPTSYRFQ